MSKKYNKILIGYVQKTKAGDKYYLSIKNVSQEPVIIDPGEKVYLNKTPSDLIKKYPKVPHYSKSEVVEMLDDEETEKITKDIPF